MGGAASEKAPAPFDEREVRRVLIVEDDEAVMRALTNAVERMGYEVMQARSVFEATVLLSSKPDLLVIDVMLPDASGLEVARAASRIFPAPIMVAMSGAASPDEAFALAQLGVRAYLKKPIELNDLRTTLERAISEPPNFEPLAAAQVGHVAVKQVQASIRRVMVAQALALSAGHHGRAARLLRVSRQAVQQFLDGGSIPGMGKRGKGDDADPEDSSEG